MKKINTRTGLIKFSSFAIGCMMLFTAVAPSAHAQSVSALQQQINALLAQVAILQAQISGQGSTSIACPYTWIRPLTNGSTGLDVLKLQQFLNSDTSTQVAFSGAGSPGMETQYYGPLTAAAVSKFQVKYRGEILTPLGLVSPTGYFGPSSIAKANELCRTVVTPTDPDDDDDTSDNDLDGGEAYLTDYKLSSGDDTSLQESQSSVHIADVEFEVKDGDVRIDRIDVAFTHVNGDEDEPWDTFDEVSIWADGEEIAQMSTDDEDDWTEIDSNTHYVRLSNIDYIVDEGDAAALELAVSIANAVDGADTGASWDVYIPDDGIRVQDGLNLTEYTGSDSEDINIDINEEGSQDELAVHSSSEDPETTTLNAERNNNSDWQTVFAFELDADDSANDITVDKLPVALTVSSSTVNTFMRDVRLVIDGETYDDVVITNGSTNYMVFDLDSDLVIDAGDTVTVEVQIELLPLAANYEGVTIQGSASSTSIEAEGTDDLAANQLSGAATGNLHSIRTEGALIEMSSTSETVRTNASNDVSDDEGVFTIKFDVTAFESDLYINRSATNGTTFGTAGVNYAIEDSAGDEVSTGDFASSLSSNASVSGNRYRVPEGSTKTFTLTVAYDPATSGFYQLQLYSLNSATTNVDPAIYQRALPESRFETDPLSI